MMREIQNDLKIKGMKKEELKISINERKENFVRNSDYEIKVADLVLGRGISVVKIDMSVGKRPINQ